MSRRFVLTLVSKYPVRKIHVYIKVDNRFLLLIIKLKRNLLHKYCLVVDIILSLGTGMSTDDNKNPYIMFQFNV